MFAGFFVTIITPDHNWILLAIGGFSLLCIGVLAGIYAVWQLAGSSGKVYYLVDLVNYALDEPLVVGFQTDPYQELPPGNLHPEEDLLLVQAIKKLNEDAKQRDSKSVDCDPKDIFKGANLDLGMSLCYTSVQKVSLDLDEDIDDVDMEEELTKKTHTFNICDTKVIIWAVWGDFAKVMRPRKRVEHGIFSLFSRKVAMVKMDGTVIRELHPGVLVIYVNHTTQQTYDTALDINATFNPNNVAVQAGSRYCSILESKNAHLEAVIQNTEVNRDLWMGNAIRAEDGKNTYIEEHEGTPPPDETEGAKLPETIIPPPEQRYGAGIAIGIVLGILATLVWLALFMHIPL